MKFEPVNYLFLYVFSRYLFTVNDIELNEMFEDAKCQLAIWKEDLENILKDRYQFTNPLIIPLLNFQTEREHSYNNSHIRTVIKRVFAILKRTFSGQKYV